MANQQQSSTEVSLLGDNTVDSVFKVLSEMQTGFKSVVDVLQDDGLDVDIIEKGVQQKPGETSFRNTISHK